MDHLWQDVRYAVRRLVAAKWFAMAAVVTLGLGIGTNTAVFTFVNAVLLRGLPFEDPDRIMSLSMQNQQGQETGISFPEFEDIVRESRTIESAGISLSSSINISEQGNVPEQVPGAYVSHAYFDVLRVRPIIGRDFLPEDDVDGAAPVVLIGHALWQNRYGGDPNIAGRTIRVNSLVADIVGVMPEGMQFPNNNDIWIAKSNLPPASTIYNRATRSFAGVARLAPGVTFEQAQEELARIGQGFAEQYPEVNAEIRPYLIPYSEEVNGSEIEIMFLSLMGAVAFVLLIACANVANLLLARAAQRSREIAVRVSIGATRGRIVRQLLVESAILAILAGVFGLAIAVYGVQWFDANTQNVGKPYWMEFTLDGTVFLYLAAICVGTVLLAGLAPALQVSRTDVNAVLKDGGRGGSAGMKSRRWVGFLSIGQVILTLILLSGATFMMRSFMNLYRSDVGFDSSRLLLMSIYLPLTQYPDPEPRQRLWEEFEGRLEGLPGVEATALTTAPPMAGGGSLTVEVEGGDDVPVENRPRATTLTVGDDYFETVGVPLLQGRKFQSTDGVPGSEAAIVNQRFADLHFDGQALGRRVRLGAGPNNPDAQWMTVVGVAPDVRQQAIQEVEPDPVVYRPVRADPARVMTLLVRTQSDPAAATGLVRDALAPVDPDLPLFDVRTMDDLLAEQRWPFRVFGLMFSLFAGIALILSAVGLYTVTAQAVLQRTQEFGIRMSIGATPRQISMLALRRGLVHLAIGIPVGLLGAFGVGNLLQSLLVRIEPTDPITFLTIVSLLIAVIVLACLQPARRAAKLDPMVAFRESG